MSLRMLQPVARRGSVAVVSVLRRTAMEGTKYSERESAAEAAYIKKHEAQLAAMRNKKTDERSKDKAEVKAFLDQAKRPHVKELLQDLYNHM